MKKDFNMKERRDFLKLSASYGGMMALSSMGLPSSLFANAPAFDDYKAIVVVLMHGGNDSINMFIPSGDDPLKGYDNYASIRSSLKVNNLDLSSKLGNETNPYSLNDSISSSYLKGFYKSDVIDGLATNALMPELAKLINDGNIAVVSNVGNLIQPTSREDVLNKTKPLPPFLYSHNSQRKLIFNGQANKLNKKGWAGAIADNWKNINNGSVYGMNISLSGVSHLLYGRNTNPLILKPKKITKYNYINSDVQRELYNKWINLEKNNIFETLYSNKRKHSFDVQDTIINDWDNQSPNFTSKNTYNEDLFSLPSNETLGISSNDSVQDNLLKQFKAVAKLAYIGKNKGLKRQIFYVKQGGYDTHSNQAQKHATLLRELSLGLGDFYSSLKDTNMENEITTFNISDFGRSIGNNGDGTDHAWGAHHFVMGGSVKGGLYGELPDLTLGGINDASNKGRLIPNISMSQYFNTIIKWFGADEATIRSIFPEIDNFSLKNIGFMR